MSIVRSRSAALLALMSWMTWGCGGESTAPEVTPPPPPPPPPPATVATVSVTPGTPQLVVGRTVQLAATPRDASGAALSRTVAWRSEAASVASVSSTGLVSAVAVGSATIIATSDGISGSVTVTVLPVPVASVAIGAISGALVPRETRVLSATVRDSTGAALAGRTVAWRSSSDSIATISADGELTARTTGAVRIFATSEGRSDSLSVNVVDGGFVTSAGGTVTGANGAFELTIPAAAVAGGTALQVVALASPPEASRLVPGTAFALTPDSLQFAASAALSIRYATPASAALPRQFRVHRWTGSAWTLLESTVDTSTRRVVASATRAGVYALLEVPRAVAAVVVTPDTVTLARGLTRQLIASVRDADGDTLADRDVVWSSSNSAIATVSASGLVTAVAGGGPVTVTATSEGRVGAASITVTVPFGFAQLFAGPFVTCGLTADGEAWCWGSNADCEVGVTPCTTTEPRPVRVSTTLRFAEMAPADEFTCGLTIAGAAYCWGSDAFGGLGNGAGGDSQTPVAVEGGHTFTTLRGTRTHVCGLRPDGEAWCWGNNRNGQLGDSDDRRTATRPVRVRGGHVFVQLHVGYDHTCGLTAAGQAWCWGENSDGESGDGSGTDRLAPVPVAGGHMFTQLSLGDYHSCGLTAAGALWCWGWNAEGQLGDGTRSSRFAPVRVLGGDVFTSVHANGWSTCALLAAGEAKCWGENAEGQLGIGGVADRLTPTSVTDSLRFSTLTSGGGYHVCGRAQGEVWYCWGWNEYGQIGDGTQLDRRSPVVLPLPMPSAGTLAISRRADGALVRAGDPATRATRRKSRVP